MAGIATASKTTAATGVESDKEKGFDREKMVAEEVERLEAWYKDKGGIRPKWDLSTYVNRVLDSHIGLAAKFGGWRYHSEPYGHMPLSLNELTTLIQKHQDEWAKGVTFYAKMKDTDPNYRPPEKQPPLPLRHWTSELDELYCKTLNCCFPAPVPNLDLWHDRVFTAADGKKEAVMEYAARRTVKVRTGQAPSRAVLAEVRKVFADYPLYVKFWETLCDKIGVAWASSKGIPITLSFAPTDFIRMGHMGEGGSCYQTGGGYEYSKLNLSLVTDSLVVMFYKDFEPDDKKPNPSELRFEKQTGRCWAILDVPNGGGVFSNAYLQDFKQTSPSIVECLKQLFDWPDVKAGQDANDALSPLSGHAYVNGDRTLFLASINSDAKLIGKPKTSAGVRTAVSSNIKEMVKRNWQHQSFPCRVCGQRYGGNDGFKQCVVCRNEVCYNCKMEKTDCCGQLCCAGCRTGKNACYGCKKATCGRCPGFKYTLCRETNHQYCAECVPKFLFPCLMPGCKTVTEKPMRCSHDEKITYCAQHGAGKLRTCNRCMKLASLKHITRCPNCKMRHCDNCAQDGELKTARSLCKVCLDEGVKLPEVQVVGEPSEEVLAKFKRQLDALPVDIKDDIEGALLDLYEWDADALLGDV
jgi:hypothetical protein